MYVKTTYGFSYDVINLIAWDTSAKVVWFLALREIRPVVHCTFKNKWLFQWALHTQDQPCCVNVCVGVYGAFEIFKWWDRRRFISETCSFRVQWGVHICVTYLEVFIGGVLIQGVFRTLLCLCAVPEICRLRGGSSSSAPWNAPPLLFALPECSSDGWTCASPWQCSKMV